MRKCEGSQGWFTVAFSDKLLSNLEETPDEITLRSKNALLANARSGERVNRVECQATYKRLERLDARAYRALLTIDRKLAEISVIDGQAQPGSYSPSEQPENRRCCVLAHRSHPYSFTGQSIVQGKDSLRTLREWGTTCTTTMSGASELEIEMQQVDPTSTLS